MGILQEKCTQYWPDKADVWVPYGKFEVRLAKKPKINAAAAVYPLPLEGITQRVLSIRPEKVSNRESGCHLFI